MVSTDQNNHTFDTDDHPLSNINYSDSGSERSIDEN